MYNYCNTLNHNLKRGVLKFSEKISKNLSRPDFKFVSQMIFGILSSHFKKNNIRAFDRGYDNNRYYEYLIKNKEKFVIRAKKNRDVIYKGERINILELAHKFKGKYSLKFKKKNGINADCKITIIPIRLVCRTFKMQTGHIRYAYKKAEVYAIILPPERRFRLVLKKWGNSN